MRSCKEGVLSRIEGTCLVDDEDKACGEDWRMRTRDEKKVQSCRAGVLDWVEETYLVNGKTCRDNENMVTKLIIEKNNVSLLAK